MEDPDLAVEDRISAFINNSLSVLTKDDVDIDDSCPICLVSFESLLAESEPNSEECGVTKLNCSHIFCRKDLLEWIRNLHGSCPTCRYEFLDIHPPGSDDEYSSDGGEYIPPNDDDEEDEDAFIDTSDGFTDTDFDMEVDEDDLWERSDGSEDMQVNAESEPSSEGDSMEDQDEGVAVEVNVSVMDGDDSSDEAQAEEPK
ncbi:RING-type domain-containing protein [Mycena venus]|uniref:Anaphase-promoting complex subunit 11 n=1 Tax=Mycena venus TaxID=2733690 RepID=A0A8H6Y546_9AGAR|nr:RING-type domain-containing protein [Mycena venus]